MQEELTWSESDSERFEGSGVLVTQAKLVQTPGLAGQLIKIKVQHYYHDLILHFTPSAWWLACSVTVYRNAYFAIAQDLFCNFYWEFVCFRLFNVCFNLKSWKISRNSFYEVQILLGQFSWIFNSIFWIFRPIKTCRIDTDTPSIAK